MIQLLDQLNMLNNNLVETIELPSLLCVSVDGMLRCDATARSTIF